MCYKHQGLNTGGNDRTRSGEESYYKLLWDGGLQTCLLQSVNEEETGKKVEGGEKEEEEEEMSKEGGGKEEEQEEEKQEKMDKEEQRRRVVGDVVKVGADVEAVDHVVGVALPRHPAAGRRTRAGGVPGAC